MNTSFASPNAATKDLILHESNFTNNEVHDESNTNDLYDSSTYNIAEAFYYDLECFITDHNEDNIVDPVSDVIEFELLSHNLLHYHNHHLNFDTEDHEHLHTIFTNNIDGVYDPEDSFYDLETLNVILLDYEELSKNFELIIKSSTNNSDIFLTTSGADDLVRLGRGLNVLTSMIPNNMMLEIRTLPDKNTKLSSVDTHPMKLLHSIPTDREPPDRDPSDGKHSDNFL